MPDSAQPEGPLSIVLARRPTVRVNQLGYLPHGPKWATWVTDELVPIEFTVVASDSSVTLRGQTRPWPTRPEPTSGESVRVIDFTDVTGAGADYQVLVGDQLSHRVRIAQDLYDQLARDALGLFLRGPTTDCCPHRASRGAPAPGLDRTRR